MGSVSLAIQAAVTTRCPALTAGVKGSSPTFGRFSKLARAAKILAVIARMWRSLSCSGDGWGAGPGLGFWDAGPCPRQDAGEGDLEGLEKGGDGRGVPQPGGEGEASGVGGTGEAARGCAEGGVSGLEERGAASGWGGGERVGVVGSGGRWDIIGDDPRAASSAANSSASIRGPERLAGERL